MALLLSLKIPLLSPGEEGVREVVRCTIRRHRVPEGYSNRGRNAAPTRRSEPRIDTEHRTQNIEPPLRNRL